MGPTSISLPPGLERQSLKLIVLSKGTGKKLDEDGSLAPYAVEYGGVALLMQTSAFHSPGNRWRTRAE